MPSSPRVLSESNDCVRIRYDALLLGIPVPRWVPPVFFGFSSEICDFECPLTFQGPNTLAIAWKSRNFLAQCRRALQSNRIVRFSVRKKARFALYGKFSCSTRYFCDFWRFEEVKSFQGPLSSVWRCKKLLRPWLLVFEVKIHYIEEDSSPFNPIWDWMCDFRLTIVVFRAFVASDASILCVQS